jgi:hypothetical protein
MRDAWRARKKVTTDSYCARCELEVGTPTSRKPAGIQWSPEPIPRTALIEDIQHELQIFRLFTDDPVTIFLMMARRWSTTACPELMMARVFP